MTTITADTKVRQLERALAEERRRTLRQKELLTKTVAQSEVIPALTRIYLLGLINNPDRTLAAMRRDVDAFVEQLEKGEV